MNKKFNAAPLPFQGQKRRFAKKFNEALDTFPKQATYVDLFGGSGLLAQIVKQKYPTANVVWNDYDNYYKRIKAIPQTNILLAKLRVLTDGIERKKKVPTLIKDKLLEVVKCHQNEFGYVDYITLSGSLLFSAKYVLDFDGLIKETFYNRVKKSDYNADGYLVNVERVSNDYKVLFDQYKSDSTIFLIDPPYLSTDTTTYNSDSYWKLRDYLDVLSVLDDSRYFYFTSNKSQVVELCQWIETRTSFGNPFEGSTISTTATQINRNSKYIDMMLYK